VSCRQIYVVANPQQRIRLCKSRIGCRQIYVVANPQLGRSDGWRLVAVGKSTLSPIRNPAIGGDSAGRAVGKSTLSPISNIRAAYERILFAVGKSTLSPIRNLIFAS